jgi:hypothetical protein
VPPCLNTGCDDKGEPDHDEECGAKQQARFVPDPLELKSRRTRAAHRQHTRYGHYAASQPHAGGGQQVRARLILWFGRFAPQR